ncbi:hypothetical protein ACWGI8_04345, partial [Streptomyces sp. NPDC054841]
MSPRTWMGEHVRIFTTDTRAVGGGDVQALRRFLRPLTPLSVALGLLLAGCAGTTGEQAGPQSEAAPTAAECAQVAAVPLPAGARSVALVVDNTASRARQGMPPAVAERLQAAQRGGEVLTILAVNGAGAAPR